MAKISTKEEIVDIYLKYQKSLFHLAMTYVGTLYLAEDLRRDLSRLFSPAEYKCPTLL